MPAQNWRWHTESKGRSHLLITSQDLLWQECKYVCSKVFSFKTANFMVRLNGTLKYRNLRKKSCGPRVHIKLANTCCEAAVPWVRFIWANEIWLANYALIVSQNYMQFAFGKSLINSNDNANAFSKHSFTELMILVNLIWFATQQFCKLYSLLIIILVAKSKSISSFICWSNTDFVILHNDVWWPMAITGKIASDIRENNWKR